MHPILLAGAAVVGLPVLLHLILRQEPQRLPFPALRFLKLRKKVSQRKLRLRQILLLALRCVLLALFALALYQPRLTGGGLAGLADEQPVACVLVVDTSPSMGYTVGGATRLADARKRAGELLDELPAGSKVAVVDPADPAVQWEPTPGDARRKLDALLDPHGGGPPLTAGVTAAYQLLRTADDPGAEPLPKLLAVFTDRAASSWPADRTADLVALRDQLPPPGVSQLVFDVGTDAPADVAVTDLQATPASGPAGPPVTVTAAVQATGAEVQADVALSVDGGPPDRRDVRVPVGPPVAVRFSLADLKPGLHQATLSLRDDALGASNVRYVTLKVGAARTLLTVCDDPADAALWEAAHAAVREFGVVTVTPEQARDFERYEFVCLLGVADPAKPLSDGQSLWDRLQPYLERGGKLLVVLGRDDTATKSYDRPFLPGKPTGLVDAAAENRDPPKPGEPDRRGGVAWKLDDAAESKPLLAGFREWRLANTDFLVNPRRATKYWNVEAPPGNVVVRYDDRENRPAILEKELPGGGRVVLLTTRLDAAASAPGEGWNDYWQVAGSSWPTAVPHRLAVYLAGSTADAAFTFPTGQPVAVPLPKGGLPVGTKLVLEGPGVTGPEATTTVVAGQTEWRLPPGLSLTAGHFRVRAEGGGTGWEDGFSLNPPAGEFDLSKAPAERVEAVTGADSVVPVGKAVALREVLAVRTAGELQLFPWLLVGVLVLFAGEGLLANRFYRG